MRCVYASIILCHVLVSYVTLATNKNVLLLIVDDMRPDINFYSSYVRTSDVSTTFVTPNMDNLAANSLVMTHAYSQVALCGPSRASFLTSRYPDTLKVIKLSDDFRATAPTVKTMPGYFRDAGYNVQGMGKIFHDDDLEHSYDLSFTEYTHVDDHWDGRNFHDSWRAVTEAERAATPLIDDVIRDTAINKLNQVADAALNGTQNFFMAVGFKKPHLNWIFPDQYLADYPTIELPPNFDVPTNYPPIAWSECGALCDQDDIVADGVDCSNYENSTMTDATTIDLRRAYFSCITYIDDLMGDVLQRLDELGLADDTIVAFMSDHGWQLREHNGWCKQTNFEASLRIPMMIRIPGATDAGIVTHKLVEAIDVMPTLVEAAGFTPLNACPVNNPLRNDACTEGHSLLPLVSDPDLSSWKTTVYSQIWRNGKDIPNGGKNMMGYSVRDVSHRYTHYVKFNKRRWSPNWKSKVSKYEDMGLSELYDLVADPWEDNNLIDSNGPESGRVERAEKQYYRDLKAKFPK